MWFGPRNITIITAITVVMVIPDTTMDMEVVFLNVEEIRATVVVIRSYQIPILSHIRLTRAVDSRDSVAAVEISEEVVPVQTLKLSHWRYFFSNFK